MTHFSDGVNVGNFPGIPSTGAGPLNNNNQKGAGLITNVLHLDAIVSASTAAALVASAIVNGAAVLTSGTGGVTAGIGPDGVTAVKIFDVPRAILITGGSATVTAANFTVKGWDLYDQALTEVITGTTGTATATGKKAFATVASITSSTTTTAPVTIGSSTKLGLAYFCSHINYLEPWQNNTSGTPAVDAGTFVAGDTTSPATTTTGDVRGTYTPTTVGAVRISIFGYLTPAQTSSTSNTLVLGVVPV